MLNNLRDRIVVQVDGQMKTGRDVVIAALLGRRGVRLRHRAARRHGLRDDARVPSEHLPGRHRDAGSRAAREVRGQAGVRRELLPVHRGGSARADGGARLPHDRRDDRPRRLPRHRRRRSDHWKAHGLDLRADPVQAGSVPASVARRRVRAQDHGLDEALDNDADRAGCRPALEHEEPVAISACRSATSIARSARCSGRR